MKCSSTWKKVRTIATVRNVGLTVAKTAGAENNWLITVNYNTPDRI